MIGIDISKIAIYVRPGRTDMRKQINGLSVMVQEEMELDPFGASVFLFCNRERKILKALYWDRTGFAMWQKRLERHRFPWPDTQAQAQIITSEQLSMLLDGIDFWKAHTALEYTSVI